MHLFGWAGRVSQVDDDVAFGSVWVVDGYNNAVLRLPQAAFAP